MDEVIADAFTAQWEWYRRTHHYDWPVESLGGKHFSDLAHPDHVAMMEELLHQGDFFGTFGVMPGSQKALEQLSSRFEIFITTAAMEYPASCAAKFAWLREHFPFISPINIVFCGDKSILAADILIDDNVRHFKRFQGQGVLFSAPHNLAVDWPVRVADWGDALSFLEGWSPAQSGTCR